MLPLPFRRSMKVVLRLSSASHRAIVSFACSTVPLKAELEPPVPVRVGADAKQPVDVLLLVAVEEGTHVEPALRQTCRNAWS